MAPSSSRNNKKGGRGKPPKKPQRKQTHQKLIPNANKDKEQPNNNKRGRNNRVKEIVFDPEARREYLRGFSDRKRQRRAYGLAMQQLKDRKARLENRKELKEAELERIEEAERLKQQVTDDVYAMNSKSTGAAASDDEDDEEETKEKTTPGNGKEDSKSQKKSDDTTNNGPKKITTTYHDESIQQQWGGDVVVTTSLALPDDSDNEEENDIDQKPKKRVKQYNKEKKDEQQEFAGNVEKYLLKLKTNMPGKKKHQHGNRGGKHGAAGMQGIGNAKEMKIAQKALARSSSSAKAPSGGKSSGGKRGRKGGKR